MRNIREALIRIINYSEFKNSYLSILPYEFHNASKLIYFPFFTKEERNIANEIERFRHTIPKIIEENYISSYTSPHSNTFTKDNKGKAVPGEYISKDIRLHMKTGSARYKGILLRRLVDGFNAKKILELGTNTGFSGCYFLSVNGVKLITIEGSDKLCQIADINMKRISTNYRIINDLFDIAIDKLSAQNEKFDCVFIDGQHEREATLHYAERLKSLTTDNSLFIFDDIYWSDDMNQAWKELCFGNNFSEAVDLFKVGVTVKRDKKNNKTVLYDIGDFLPRPRLIRTHW